MGFLAFSGYVWNDNLKYVGEYGYFWSATVKSANNAYYLNFNQDNVNPENYDNREDAQSVRCVRTESGSFPPILGGFCLHCSKSQPSESKTEARNFLLFR